MYIVNLVKLLRLFMFLKAGWPGECEIAFWALVRLPSIVLSHVTCQISFIRKYFTADVALQGILLPVCLYVSL